MAPKDEDWMLCRQQNAHGRAQASRPTLRFAQRSLLPRIGANSLAHRAAADEKLRVNFRIGCHPLVHSIQAPACSTWRRVGRVEQIRQNTEAVRYFGVKRSRRS